MSLSLPTLPEVTLQEKSFDSWELKLNKALSDFFFQVVEQLNTVAPPGSLFPFAGSTVPDGWLYCDGSSYEQLRYPELYKAIGTTWGGSGSLFSVPDFRDKVLYGVSGSYALGAAGPNISSAAGISTRAVKWIIRV